MRVVNQPADDLAFERIVNVPKRGIGDTTVKVLMEVARASRIPLFEATRQLVDTEDLKPRQRSTLNELIHQFEDWAFKAQSLPHYELAQQILDESGYTAMWQNDKSADAHGRLENLKELVRFMEEFESLTGFLEHVSLVMDRDSGEGEDAVSIMTLHSARGWNSTRSSCPAGKTGCSPTSAPLMKAARSASRKNAGSPMSALPARAAAPAFPWPRTGAPTGSGSRPSPRASSTNCRPSMSRSRIPAPPMAATITGAVRT